MKPTTPNTDPAERLLNLVIALVNTQGRMTKDQIRSSVAGYDSAASAEAFERMFERDKDLLRDLGVPIVTVDDSGHPDDVGYRVDKDSYALPPIELSSAEYAVLGLAAEFWQDRSLQLETSRALTKLRAVGSSPIDVDAASILAPRVQQAGDAYGPIFEAVLDRRAINFDYRAASTGTTQRRKVQPWRIAARGGGWYLIGWDLSREDVRAFRLSRIAGRVKASGPQSAFTVPEDIDVDTLLTGVREKPRAALLAVTPERAGALRARGTMTDSDVATRDDGRELLTVMFTNLDQFAAEVAGHGPAIVALEPVELREAVLSRLRAATRIAIMGSSVGTTRSTTDTDGVDHG